MSGIKKILHTGFQRPVFYGPCEDAALCLSNQEYIQLRYIEQDRISENILESKLGILSIVDVETKPKIFTLIRNVCFGIKLILYPAVCV